ncbi:MAG: FAD-binding protein [Dehalococcoidales bacterium]|nr:FAD-binding protein [Dehalococcoidales bacterium]
MVGRQSVSTDILIIGGGSAGAMAAIRAKEVAPALDVTVMEKGGLRRAGTLAMGMDAMNVVVIPGVTTEGDYLTAIRLLTEGIYDPAPHRVVARRSLPLVKKLESWGVKFGHGPDGAYVLHQIHPNAAFTVPMEAPDLKVLLAGTVEQLGVRAINRTMALSLLLDDRGVCGALGLDIRSGALVVCTAKAVILTAGGAARFGLPGSGYLFGTLDFPGNAGDGYALGYRAGASLVNMEYTSNHAITKDIGVPITSVAIPLGGIVVNSRGEPVQSAERSKTGSYFQQSAKRFGEQQAHGPLFLRVSHLPEERIREIERILFSTERPAQKRFFEQRGIDLRKDDVELGPTEYKLCSGHGMAGLLVNDRAETTLPGLYAAGDVASVPFQYLTGAFVMGEVAAEQACEAVGRRHQPAVPEAVVADWEREIVRLLAHRPGLEVSPHEFEYKVRRIINEYVTPPKNEWKLRNAVAWMHALREELPKVVRVRDAHELSRYWEVECIIDCAELSATAGAVRKESRWGPKHRRTDYPERDDANWLKHVVLRRGAEGTAAVDCRPVEPAAEGGQA